MRDTHSQSKAELKAVALHYDGKHSPTVTASATGDIAEQIVALAKEFNVPIYQNQELVALLAMLDLHEEVPEALYYIIAEVLAFAYQISGNIPPEFQTTKANPYKGVSPYK